MGESQVERAKIRFHAQIERVSQTDSLTEREQDALASMLQSKIFRKAASLVYREIQAAGTQILGMDLANESLRHAGSRLQGKAIGMMRAFEGLFDLLDDERFTEEKEND